ncbi:MAG: spondin domain-containing protein [Lacipirellulaceae bacterium]
MLRTRLLTAAVIAIAATTSSLSNVKAQDLQVTIENLSDTGGIFLTPLWFGFHDGSFDVYDQGVAASPGLESLAEDGSFAAISSEFMTATSSNGEDSAVFGAGGPIAPGEIASATLSVSPSNRYFSYASMVIPSNDAFIANGNPLAHQAFDAGGNFTPIEFLVLGTEVLDAGTELNTEMEAAFLNQTGPNTGDDENGVVALHPGFIGSIGNPGGTPIILSGSAINAAGASIDTIAADFTAAGYEVARISVSQIPEPTSLVLLGLSLSGMGLVRRR